MLNKIEKRGAEDACATCASSGAATIRTRAHRPDAEVPVFPTIASRFNDPGVNRLFAARVRRARAPRAPAPGSSTDPGADRRPSARAPLMPGERSRYLAEIAQGGREARARIEAQVDRRAPRGRTATRRSSRCAMRRCPRRSSPMPQALLEEGAADATRRELRAQYNRALAGDRAPRRWRSCKGWPARARAATEAELTPTRCAGGR